MKQTRNAAINGILKSSLEKLKIRHSIKSNKVYTYDVQHYSKVRGWVMYVSNETGLFTWRKFNFFHPCLWQQHFYYAGVKLSTMPDTIIKARHSAHRWYITLYTSWCGSYMKLLHPGLKHQLFQSKIYCSIGIRISLLKLQRTVTYKDL